MIAAFLKTFDGDFNYPALMLSLFLVFGISGMLWGLWGAIRTGRILFAWGSKYGGSGQFFVEQKRNPSGFWLV
jgi:hypothetical protein